METLYIVHAIDEMPAKADIINAGKTTNRHGKGRPARIHNFKDQIDDLVSREFGATEIADRLGISRASVYRYINNHNDFFLFETENEAIDAWNGNENYKISKLEYSIVPFETDPIYLMELLKLKQKFNIKD